MKRSVTSVCIQGSAAVNSYPVVSCSMSRAGQSRAVTGSMAADGSGSTPRLRFGTLMSSTAQTTAAQILFLNLNALKPGQVPLLPSRIIWQLPKCS